MAAECYWCEVKKPRIANPIGTANIPLGCCKNCQVLACGHHAQRDNHAKEYMCFHCDTSILIASGNVTTMDADLDQIAKVAVEKALGKRKYGLDYFIVDEGHLFSSFEDFKRRRNGYKDWFSEIEMFVENFHPVSQEMKYFKHLPKDAKLFFTAAAFIINKMSTDGETEEIYPSYIEKLKNEIQTRGGLQWQTNSY